MVEKTTTCVSGLKLVSLCGLQMVRPHSSCANERRRVVEGVSGTESWPQKEKSYKLQTENVMEELIAH